MIIEFTKTGDQNVCFIHFDPKTNYRAYAIELRDDLAEQLPEHVISIVPNGTPNTSSLSMKATVYNGTNNLLRQAVKKLAKSGPGEYIELLECELLEYNRAIKNKEVIFL